MVAVTGGLFVTMVVFALARQGSQFYQRESRIAETTLGNVVAFDRLTLDISRAGFMATPNLRRDPLYCGDDATKNSLPAELQNLASVRIEADEDAEANAVLQAAGRTPQMITLSGAYESVDRYEAWHVDLNASADGYTIRLQTNIGALQRLGFSAMAQDDRVALLAQLFPPLRAIRLLNIDTGTFQVSSITGTRVDGAEAYVDLSGTPALNLTGQRCGLRGTTLVNVINIVRYRLRTVKSNPDYDDYQHLFATGNQPYEDNRMELVREELDTASSVIAASREVVAEYAVDLQFGLTAVNNTSSVFPTVFTDTAEVTTIAAPTNIPNARPQDVRAVRARLSLRSREVDRAEDITPGANIAPGLYRIQLTDSATKATGYARVRTLQTDAVLASHMEIQWR
jgi:hypothetical protein